MEKREKLVLITSLVLIAFSAVLYLVLPKILDTMKPHNPNFIGLSTMSSGDVKVRYEGSLTWRKLDKKDRIFANSYLFTGPNSSSSFAFLDNSTIQLEENSLVSLNFQSLGQDGTVSTNKEGKAMLKVGVMEGKIGLRLRPDSQVKAIQMEQSLVVVGNGPALLQIEGGVEEKVAVMDGEVSLTAKGGTYEVKAGEKAIAGEDDELKREEVPKEVMAEMRRIAEEHDRALFEEEKKKREFLYLIKHWYLGLVGNENQ